jgi:predicted metal-dependent phosphotriesterase family hydrolase
MASGKVQTTTGLINPDELGNTLMHERILISLALPLSASFLLQLDIHIKYTTFFEEPSDPCEKEFAHKPFSLEHGKTSEREVVGREGGREGRGKEMGKCY